MLRLNLGTYIYEDVLLLLVCIGHNNNNVFLLCMYILLLLFSYCRHLRVYYIDKEFYCIINNRG